MLQEFLVPFISLIFIIIYVFNTKMYRWDVVRFPYFIFGLMFFFAAGLLYKEYKEYRVKVYEKRGNSNKKEKGRDVKKAIDNESKPVLLLVTVFGYAILLNQIGYILATLIFLVAIMLLLKASVKSTLIFAPIVTIFVYVLFDIFINLGLPRGFLEIWIRGLF
ncbi:MAG: tripartite tricarboxylate transporter TctB family protein [Actinobacteria bacterium]|nr:tripartite tricarboxylate transporter TctB family protein [Actinomycetota bacterium]